MQADRCQLRVPGFSAGPETDNALGFWEEEDDIEDRSDLHESKEDVLQRRVVSFWTDKITEDYSRLRIQSDPCRGTYRE